MAALKIYEVIISILQMRNMANMMKCWQLSNNCKVKRPTFMKLAGTRGNWIFLHSRHANPRINGMSGFLLTTTILPVLNQG